MKACREDTYFKPVTLTLESQAEVDAIYTVLNHTQLCEALELGEGDFEWLEPFKSNDSAERLHTKLNKLIRSSAK